MINIEDFIFPEKTALDACRTLPCMICGEYPSDPHHVKSRGAGGTDEANNLVPLCRKHHTEIHKRGVLSFSYKYSDFRDWLRANRPGILLKELL